MSIENFLEGIEDKLEVISDKGNRELVHVKITHPMPDFFLKELDSKKRRGMKSFSRLLNLKYNDLTLKVLNLHQKNPFKRIYVEGHHKLKKITGNINKDQNIVYKPARALIERGAELMITEHIGFSLILDMFSKIYGGYFNAIKVIEEKKQIPISAMKKKFLDSQNPFLDIIIEFFDGLEYMDFHATRESWIGRNINKTLKENERGILFLGGEHGHERIYNQLENTRYFTYRQLSEEELDYLLKLSTP